MILQVGRVVPRVERPGLPGGQGARSGGFRWGSGTVVGHDGRMPDDARPGLRVTTSLVVPEAELSWRFSRSSGPGGQGVNTTDSRVELSWDVARSAVLTEAQRARMLDRLGRRVVDGVVTVAASEHREQRRNREAARTRLAALLAAAVLRGTDQRTGAVVASAVPELAVLRGARSVVAEDVRTLLLAAAGRPDHPVVAPSVPG